MCPCSSICRLTWCCCAQVRKCDGRAGQQWLFKSVKGGGDKGTLSGRVSFHVLLSLLGLCVTKSAYGRGRGHPGLCACLFHVCWLLLFVACFLFRSHIVCRVQVYSAFDPIECQELTGVWSVLLDPAGVLFGWCMVYTVHTGRSGPCVWTTCRNMKGKCLPALLSGAPLANSLPSHPPHVSLRQHDRRIRDSFVLSGVGRTLARPVLTLCPRLCHGLLGVGELLLLFFFSFFFFGCVLALLFCRCNSPPGLYGCHGYGTQRWKVTADGKIRSAQKHSGKEICIGSKPSVGLFRCLADDPDFTWKREGNMFRSISSNQHCLERVESGGVAILGAGPCSNSPAQQWIT